MSTTGAADDLIDYDHEVIVSSTILPSSKTATVSHEGASHEKEVKKGSYVGIHFRDFLLKPELLLAISDCGFEHPSEIQQECIPQAILGMDVLCQAKSGMGKTLSLFWLRCNSLREVSVLVLCHTRELAFQIKNEYARFIKYMPDVRVEAV